ncbi:MAG: TIGR03546 family protein [Treponema sp.]|nr:TIGR03546 family protein [Treponema sp.]
MIKAIARLIVALNGNIRKSQLAGGFAWGVLLGLVPAGNFFWVVLLVVSFFFKHNHASKVLLMLLIKLFNPLFAPLVDLLGWEILHFEALRPLFTSLYNMPFVPFTRFYNTLVAGGLVGGLVLWLPVFLLSLGLVSLYRNTIAPALRKAKIFKVIAKIPFINQISQAVEGVSHGR